MGKYTRKAKMTPDVSLMDVSQSPLGVRTRAKTLALQRLQSTAAASKPDSCYLELRSRRLEKTMQPQNSRRGCDSNAEIKTHEECSMPGGAIEGGGLGIEASFGENNLDFEVRERGTRESTPCSLIRGADTPGSTTKPRSSSGTASRRVPDGPCSREVEEFFAREEQSMQRRFIEKYNFDVVKDLPLPGRYEWVAVMP